jgi:PAP2 superfamily
MLYRKFAIAAVAAAVALALSQRAAEARSNTPPCVLRSLPPVSVLSDADTASLCVLQGLAPVTALNNTAAGKAALEKNFVVTGEIQHGAIHQPTLLPFPEQQQQALRDAYITGDNAYGLADGLGTRLGDSYQALTGCESSDDGGKTTKCGKNITDAVGNLIAYANATTGADSMLGKYFFANETIDDKTPASPEAKAILTTIKGTADIFGKAYRLPAGGPAADPYGNSRPFQTQPKLYAVHGKDFFSVRSGSIAYLFGPTQNLIDSPSYPSGHTTYGYTEGLLLALLVPERYPQMIARAAEYGNDRIILGAHYAMDVLAGRTLATYEMAQLLANTAGFVGVPRKRVDGGEIKPINDFRAALLTAGPDATAALKTGCGGSIAACAAQDQSRFANPARNRAFYLATQAYGLPTVFKQNVGRTEDVGQLAPEAGYLLCVAFPYLTRERANAILTETEGPGGGFLDDGSAFGVYSRLDLYRAAEKAIAENPAAAEKGRVHKLQRKRGARIRRGGEPGISGHARQVDFMRVLAQVHRNAVAPLP